MSPIKHIPVSAGLSLDKMVGTKFKIVGKKIGAGNFGEVRLGKNVMTEEKVAVKIERILQDQKGLCATIRLKQEYEMLKLIYKGYPSGHKINGIPKLYHFARCGTLDCMVLELLGPNLEDLFELCGCRFSLKTVLMIGFQLLDRIETVHNRGLVYRDVKPENFLLGRKNTKEANIIHLVDFGLATYFRNPETGKHLPFMDLKTMTGTARYMSVQSHLGKSQSRRDDLESIFYVLLYFLKGRLPWQGIKTGGNVKEKYKRIRDAKLKTSPRSLCNGLPKEFESYFIYVKNLKFSEKPNYEYLKDLFHSLFEAKGFQYSNAEFDWTKLGDLPTDVNRFNKARRESKVSSVNTEDSETYVADSKNSKYNGEDEDKLGDLGNIKKNAKTLGRLNTSQINLRSLTLSETGGCGLYNSSFDITKSDDNLSTMPITNQPSSVTSFDRLPYHNKTTTSNDNNQRGSPSQGYHSNDNIAVSKEITEVEPAATKIESQNVCLGCQQVQNQNDDTAKEVTSFLCFEWRSKKKKKFVHHTCLKETMKEN